MSQMIMYVVQSGNESFRLTLRADWLGEMNVPRKVGDTPEYLTEKVIQDISLRCCFVTNINRGRELTQAMSDPSNTTSLTSCLTHMAPLVTYPISGS